MTDEPRILARDDNGVRLITLNRPAVLNAFDSTQYAELNAAYRAALADDAVSVVVVTGAGRAFSAGADISQMAAAGSPAGGGSTGEGSGGERADMSSPFNDMLETLENFGKPLIAAVNGVAVGIGCTMLGHFDVVLMARGARLRMPFASLGLAPEGGSTVLLPQRIGWQNAALALFIGDWIDADTALRWGMAQSISEDGAVLDDALALAATIARTPQQTLIETKTMLLAGRTPAVARARPQENAALARVSGSPANRAAIERFLSRSS